MKKWQVQVKQGGIWETVALRSTREDAVRKVTLMRPAYAGQQFRIRREP